jgi:hypothetical protein
MFCLLLFSAIFILIAILSRDSYQNLKLKRHRSLTIHGIVFARNSKFETDAVSIFLKIHRIVFSYRWTGGQCSIWHMLTVSGRSNPRDSISGWSVKGGIRIRVETNTVFSFPQKTKIKRKWENFREISFCKNFCFRENFSYFRKFS